MTNQLKQENRRKNNYHECVEHAHQVRRPVVLSFGSHLRSSFAHPFLTLFTYNTIADTVCLCKCTPALQLHDSGKSIESVCGHDREGFQTLVP
jgi:hypothetical protein